MDMKHINEFAIAHGYESGENLISILDEQNYVFSVEEFVSFVENNEIVDKGPRKLRAYFPAEYDAEERKVERERTEEERFEVANINFRDINAVLGLDSEIMDAWEEGIFTISYVDEDLKSHVIKMEDDPVFMEYKKKLEDEWDVSVYHGIKWDLAESPVFLAMSDDCRYLNRQEGLLINSAYRAQEMQVYYWVDGKSYDDQAQVDVHDGVLYLTQAFPGLQAKENDMELSLHYKRKAYNDSPDRPVKSHNVNNIDRIIQKNQEHMRELELRELEKEGK